MFMEVATTTGALIGASLALRVSTAAIAELFGAVLLYSAGGFTLAEGEIRGRRQRRSCCEEP
jgi:uncharacterized membrane protein YfcA